MSAMCLPFFFAEDQQLDAAPGRLGIPFKYQILSTSYGLSWRK
jgi:hypothetical protein